MKSSRLSQVLSYIITIFETSKIKQKFTCAGASIPVDGNKLLSHRTFDEMLFESASLFPSVKAIIVSRFCCDAKMFTVLNFKWQWCSLVSQL